MCVWLLVWFVGGHVRTMWVWWCIGIFLLEFWNLLCLKKTDLGCGLVRLGGPQGWVFEFCNANQLFEVGANEFWLHLVFLCVFPSFSDVYTFILISELAGIWILHFRWAHGTTDGIDSATGAKRPPAYAAQLLCSPAAGETGGRHNKTQNWFSSEENTRFGSARKLWFHPFRLAEKKSKSELRIEASSSSGRTRPCFCLKFSPTFFSFIHLGFMDFRVFLWLNWQKSVSNCQKLSKNVKSSWKCG